MSDTLPTPKRMYELWEAAKEWERVKKQIEKAFPKGPDGGATLAKYTGGVVSYKPKTKKHVKDINLIPPEYLRVEANMTLISANHAVGVVTDEQMQEWFNESLQWEFHVEKPKGIGEDRG